VRRGSRYKLAAGERRHRSLDIGAQKQVAGGVAQPHQMDVGQRPERCLHSAARCRSVRVSVATVTWPFAFARGRPYARTEPVALLAGAAALQSGEQGDGGDNAQAERQPTAASRQAGGFAVRLAVRRGIRWAGRCRPGGAVSPRPGDGASPGCRREGTMGGGFLPVVRCSAAVGVSRRCWRVLPQWPTAPLATEAYAQGIMCHGPPEGRRRHARLRQGSHHLTDLAAGHLGL
jgi:hypothetical protein